MHRASGRCFGDKSDNEVGRSKKEPDPVRQLAQQLFMLLQQNTQKYSGMAFNLSQNSSQTKWVLDSGATDHMTGNKDLLDNYRKYEKNQFVTVANGEKMEILGCGSINLFSKEISNILFVQNCSSNLLSIRKITNQLNCDIIFSSNNVIFQELTSKRLIGEGFCENGLYFLNKEKYIFNTKNEKELSTLWHNRIGHPSDKILKSIFDFKGLDSSNCEIYKLGKHTRLPFDSSNYKSKKSFELIHSDVWDPAPIESFNGYIE
jgi:GAG-pre-integrase domain